MSVASRYLVNRNLKIYFFLNICSLKNINFQKNNLWLSIKIEATLILKRNFFIIKFLYNIYFEL